MDFGYCLLRGKNGVAGYVRDMGNERRIWIRQLPAGADCALYLLSGGESRLIARQQADREGRAVFSCGQMGRLYLTVGEQVAAWEAGSDAEETYCLACACQEKNKAAVSPGKKDDGSSRVPNREQPETLMPIPLSPAAPTPPPEASAAVPAPQRQTEPESAPPEKDVYSLRPAGSGEPVDALPALRWPAAARELQGYFRGRMPFSPFDAPGWRFVRIPSGIPGAVYCAAGYLARDGRVCRTALAVPGAPHHPPAPLPDFRYRTGNQGIGYWVKETAY